MTATRRPTARQQTAGPEKVKALLQELAYVLHVTRKVNRQIAWPVPAPRSRAAEPASPIASA
jgi:hypothetical protein